MSWLGGSISSLTGQLSNLTKDILTEGTEEISDPATELQLAQDKLKSADQLINAVKQENEKLKFLNRELEEKAESSELQINNISKQYRLLLEERQEEIKDLKQKHNELLDFQAKSALSGSETSPPTSLSTTVTSRHNTGGFQEDDHDLGDTISLQHEINKLRQDVQKLQAECQHWRSVAGQLSGNQTDEVQSKHTESVQLKARIQELEKQLIVEKEHHQHEVVSLQDVHREKLSNLKRTYKQDVARLEEKLSLLQDDSGTKSPNASALEISQAKQALEVENKEMKEKLESMSKQIDKLNRDMHISDRKAQQLQTTVAELEEEKKKNEVELIQTSIVDWINEMKEGNIEIDQNNLAKHKKYLLEKPDLDCKIYEAGRKLRQIKTEASKLQKMSDSTKPSSETSDGLDLEERHRKLQEEVLELKKQNQNHVVEKDLYEQRLKSYRRRLAELQDDDLDEEFTDDSELNLSGGDAVIDSSTPLDEQVRILQSKVQQYQTDIEQFEYVKSDWQMEKEALEEVLLKLREDLKQAELSLAEAQAQQGIEEVGIPRKSVSAEEENETEDDDANRFASQINELLLGNQELEEERDQLLQQLTELKEKNMELEKETDTLNSSLIEQKMTSGDNDKIIKEKETILKTLQQEKEELETSLDQLDLQHQEEQMQLINIKDNLAKKTETLTQQLKEKEDMINNLNKKLNSQSENQKCHETNTEMISNLKTELEKLSNDLKQSEAKSEEYLKEIQGNKIKLQNGAVAVNDLHMEIREFESLMSKSKEESSKKSSVIKELREEKTRLVQGNQNLEDRVEELEEEVEKWQSINEKVQVEQTSNNQNELVEKLRLENHELQERVRDLSLEKESLTTTEEQTAKLSELQTKLDAMSSEKQRLEKELDLLQQKSSNQVKHYEKYIKELEESKSMDENSLQQEHQRLAHLLHQKETQISELHSQLEEVQTELEDSKETMKSAVDSQQQIASILQEKEDKIQSLLQLEGICEEQKLMIQKQEDSLQIIPELQKEIVKYKEISEDLKEELEEAQELAQENTEALNERHKTLAVITDLETELSFATESIACLDETRRKQESIIADHVKGISLLNKKSEEARHELELERSKSSHQEDLLAIIRNNLEQKEEELSKMHRKLSRATSFLNDDQKAGVEMDRPPDYSLPALEYQQTEEKADSNCFENGLDKDKLDTDQNVKVNKELDQLQERIGEKDQIIHELQQKNSSLLKVLESRSMTKQNGDTSSFLDVQRLESEVKKLTTEKEQIMAIMNEKSREASTLKAEVHRLMNVVSAEKTALSKLQKDNQELNQKRDNPNDDMQKAALQQLSRLIRDKDVEIEALKQKNDTLLAVLQDSSVDNSNTQLSTLLTEKENLSKQCAALQSQNEQMIAFVNQKHQESVTYHNEVQRLSVVLGEEHQKYEAIRDEYSKIVPQFEDKKASLMKLQDELISYKQKFSEMEIKYGEMLQRSNVKDTVDASSFNAKEEELKRIQDKLIDSQKSVQEKDLKIKSLNQQNIELENELVGKEADRTSLKKQTEHLQFQLQGMQTELQELRNENSQWNQQKSEKDSENVILQEATNKLSLSLREKELEISSMKEKCETLNNIIQDQRKDQGEGQVHQGQVDRLVQQIDQLREQTVSLQQERDQALIVHHQQQQESAKLVAEIERLREKETKMTRELDRLRSHLIQIEEGYTREALESEEREKDLRNRVAIAEEKLMSASSNVETASQHLSIQIEELKYQLQVVSGQRDNAFSQVTSMQDQCQQYACSLANLQTVLEQFQQEKESQIASESERYKEEIQALKKEYCSVQNTLIETQNQLEDASEGLEAAERLSHQLDRKEEALQALKDEVQLREKNLKLAEEEIRKLTSSKESKVDKDLIKALLIGYFTTPQSKRKEVVHTIGGVLNFNPEEFEKISEAEGSGGWVPGLFKLGRSSGPTPPSTPSHTPGKPAMSLNQSFSQLFVKFLERESSPPPPAVRLPAEQMAKELKEKHKEKDTHRPAPAFNPFTAPRHVSMPLTVGSDRSSMPDSHILMAPTNTPSFTPMFTTPAANDNLNQSNSGRSTPQNSSSAILKDVLGTR